MAEETILEKAAVAVGTGLGVASNVVDAVKEEPEESDEAVAEDSDSDSDSDVEKKADPQPLTSTFRTQCRVDCNADIPLISDGVLPYRPPRRQHTRPRRSLIRWSATGR